jgi:hypothetical protein
MGNSKDTEISNKNPTSLFYENYQQIRTNRGLSESDRGIYKIL